MKLIWQTINMTQIITVTDNYCNMTEGQRIHAKRQWLPLTLTFSPFKTIKTQRKDYSGCLTMGGRLLHMSDMNIVQLMHPLVSPPPPPPPKKTPHDCNCYHWLSLPGVYSCFWNSICWGKQHRHCLPRTTRNHLAFEEDCPPGCISLL